MAAGNRAVIKGRQKNVGRRMDFLAVAEDTRFSESLHKLSRNLWQISLRLGEEVWMVGSMVKRVCEI